MVSFMRSNSKLSLVLALIMTVTSSGLMASYTPADSKNEDLEDREWALDTSRLTNDTVRYENLQEVKVQKDSKPDLDVELASLASMEGNFAKRIATPRARIEKKKFQTKKIKAKKSRSNKSIKRI